VAIVKLENVKADVDRHGNARYYFRPPGYRPGLGIKLTRLPGIPYSTEFMDALAAAKTVPISPIKIEPGATRSRPGTLNALIARYKASAAFLKNRPNSQTQNRLMLDKLGTAFGDLLIAKFERRHAKDLLDSKTSTPTVAKRLLTILNALVVEALDLGWIKINPLVGLKVTLPKSEGILNWEEEEVAHYRANYPMGTMERAALELLLNMAARREDAIRMGPAHVKNGELTYTQIKTGAHLTIPLLPATLEAIAALGPNGHLVFLLNDSSRPFTEENFTKWFAKRCRRISLNRASKTGKKLSAHGLRKATCVALAEAGCTDQHIKAISGHMSLKEVERYTKGVRQKLMARQAMKMLQAHQAAQAQAQPEGA
jgi:integrase